MKNLKSLSKRELLIINGGCKGAAYKAGKLVGDVIEVGLTIFGIGRLGKFVKHLF